MSERIKVSSIREKFPMYEDMSDEQLIGAVRKKFYSDIPMNDFVRRIDFDTERERLTPASDSFAGNLLPAAGAGMSSIVRALGGGKLLERFGLPGTKDEADRLDAPLDAAPGGTTGRVLGAATLLAPTAFIPGANTYLGAMGIGAGTGALTTEGDIGDRAKAALFGAGGGLAGNLAARGIAATGGAVKGLVEPFYRTGQERIAGKAINRFATNPSAVMAANGGRSVTGAMPTLAEASKDRGLATLQRAVGTMDPQASEAFLLRQEANNAARVGALQRITGEQPAQSSVRKLAQLMSGPTKASAEATRSAAAGASYGAARTGGVDSGMADALQPQITKLLKRPSVQDAVSAAKKLAREESIELDDMGSVQGLQYIKQALDDMIGALGPKEKNKMRLLTKTSSELKMVLDEIAPALRRADAEFAFNSVPVTRAQVGERLLNATTGALRDFQGNRSLQANAFSKALNNEQQLMKQATGFGGPRSLEDVMTPAQMNWINTIRDELETASNLSRAANGPGSQTAKMLASQNLLKNIAGPLGIPDTWLESTLSQSIMRAPQFAMKTAEARIHEKLAQGLLSPQEGQRLLAIALKAERAKPSEIALLAKALAPSALGYQTAQYGQ